ncbi:MAG: VCBS repeat-containing protein [Fidelibacterota bacterium]
MKIVGVISFLSGTAAILLLSCGKKPSAIQVDTLFTLLPSDVTHLEFENRLIDETNFNVFKYRNYYNGGGVSVGDVNNDHLPDVYMVANQQPNKLFLNEGGFQFRDVTTKAGVAGSHNWSTGANMVDINGDGRLDIYVCNSGNIMGDNRANELFINQGNGENGVPVFSEAAAQYGIDDRGFSTHAAFFDYDRDGDLDLYVMNNAFRAISSFDLSMNLRGKQDPYGGDHLYRNDGGKFTDVTKEAGIYSPVIGFGLGLSVADMDNDRWPDIYVANDFFERDYLYINNRDGTFSERLEEGIRHVSLSSMGTDIADINNDGFLDIFSTDMLPEDDYRLKTTFTFETYGFYEKKIDWGYYHQLSQNTLQLHRGFAQNGQISFSDIGLLAGVAETDWTWGALIVDLDNDGLKDIFVSNGIFRDVTDQDYLDYLRQTKNIEQILRGDRVDFPELIRRIPSNKLSNYAFHNHGDLTFTNEAKTWGLQTPSFSNGAAYGDLDGDGDHDLIVNNVNQPAFVYRNEADSLTDHHFLKVKLVGEGLNSFAVGAKITLTCGGRNRLVVEQIPTRGFQSSVDYTLVMGLGDCDQVDTVTVDWPDGTRGIMEKVPADQTVILYQRDSKPPSPVLPKDEDPIFRDVTHSFPLDYRHVENPFVDFHREPLIPHLLSTEGPRVAKGDVNGDRLEDLYLTGAKDSAGTLFLQTAAGTFIRSDEPVFDRNRRSEDVDAAFFDADGDGDLDLYVVSGGNEFPPRSAAFLDRLYINNGQGEFSQRVKALPRFYASGSCVSPGDFDGDGDMDLFVGSRSVPGRYGLTPASTLLENDGEGNFSIVTRQVAPQLTRLGMVTDAQWVDLDSDGNLDLVVVGEWMPVTVFRNSGESLYEVTSQVGLEKTQGWWNRLIAEDLNGDGIVDLVAGNLGENSKLRASPSEPVTLYVSDFDNNRLIEQILCHFKMGKNYPMLLRPDMVMQLPYLGAEFPTHASYAGKEITDIFTPQQLNQAMLKKAHTFATSVFIGTEQGTFVHHPLPAEAQFSPVYAIMARDFDSDGSKDLLLAGNLYGIKPQLGRYDASYGTLLRGDGTGKFDPVPARHTGLSVTGQVRDIVSMSHTEGRDVILFAKNDDRIQVYEIVPR